MKILYINGLYAPYIGVGAEIVLKDLLEGMHNLGHEVKVLSFWDKWDKDGKEKIIDEKYFYICLFVYCTVFINLYYQNS